MPGRDQDPSLTHSHPYYFGWLLCCPDGHLIPSCPSDFASQQSLTLLLLLLSPTTLTTMKVAAGTLAMALWASTASAFVVSPSSLTRTTRASALSMVLEMPKETKKISKLETLKVNSDHLIHPLVEVRGLDLS